MSPFPSADPDRIPVLCTGVGKSARYWVAKPNRRKALPPETRIHCYAISLSAAERLASIFNEDLKLRIVAKSVKGVYRSNPLASPEPSEHLNNPVEEP